MTARAVIASGAVIALIAACGGKVDGGSSSPSSDPSPVPTSQLPPPGGDRGRPPPGVSAASMASQIADTYCKAFSSCCVGAGQPPIDVARCRLVVSTSVEAVVQPDEELRNVDVQVCADAIKQRLGACSAVDAPWWTSATALPLLAPSNVRAACAPLVGPAPTTNVVPCEASSQCKGLAATCAIDECTAAGPIGTACTSGAACLDGESCIDTTCSAPLNVQENGTCKSDEDCRLGLVCAKTVCLKSRDVPGISANTRFSPYRIGADTCRAYASL